MLPSCRSAAAPQVNAAGSLTNTLLALARLSQAAKTCQDSAPPLRVAAATVSGCDTLGFFYRKQLHTAGVDTLTVPRPDSNTGVPPSSQKVLVQAELWFVALLQCRAWCLGVLPTIASTALCCLRAAYSPLRGSVAR